MPLIPTLTVFAFSTLLHLLDLILKTRAIWKHNIPLGDHHPIHGFTVVICSHNELKNLKKNIGKVLAQDYPIFEVIVVLDRCTDRSFEFLESIYQNNDKLRVLTINQVPDDIHPKKYGITRAIELSRHPWILLTDADCQPTSAFWIESFNGLVNKKTEIILGVSPYVKNRGLLSRWVDFETFQTALNYVPAALNGKPYMGVGRNLAYRKSLFLSKNGFGDFASITGGDDDLFVQQHANSQNTAVNLHINSLTKSQPKRTWKKYFRQKLRHFSVGKYYVRFVKIRLTMSNLTHAVMWVSFIILVSFNPSQWMIPVVFALVLLIKGLISKFASSKLNTRWNPVLFPALDLVYAVLFPLLGLTSFFIKKVRWN